MSDITRSDSGDDVAAARSAADDALLAELTEPPSLEEAQTSLDFWQRRLADLPRLRRAARQEARASVATWEQHLREAQRARYGPSLLEQVFRALGVRHVPRTRTIITGVSVVALALVALVVIAVIALVAFWPEIAPIFHTLFGGGGNGGDGG